jgi:hypothetical protein
MVIRILPPCFSPRRLRHRRHDPALQDGSGRELAAQRRRAVGPGLRRRHVGLHGARLGTHHPHRRWLNQTHPQGLTLHEAGEAKTPARGWTWRTALGPVSTLRRLQEAPRSHHQVAVIRSGKRAAHTRTLWRPCDAEVVATCRLAGRRGSQPAFGRFPPAP